MRNAGTLASALCASAVLACTCAWAERAVWVTPAAETEPVQSPGDAADDPAIWVHPTDPGKSLIIGTDKLRGLEVYRLDGSRIQDLPTGRLNNVDLRQGVQWGTTTVDLAIASNRSNRSIEVFLIDRADGTIRHSQADRIPLRLREPYGICMYHDAKSKRVFAFVNDKDGRYQQFLMAPQGRSTLVREFRTKTQPEGCVVDDEKGVLFIGEEVRGVWKIGADPDATPLLTPIVKVGSGLRADVEGLTLIESESGKYLVVSSQGNNTFVVFAATGLHERVGRFRIALSRDQTIDGAQRTDGVAAVGGSFGELYTHGILVVQDGRNTHPREAQNFKIVSWREIELALNLMPWLDCQPISYSASCNQLPE